MTATKRLSPGFIVAICFCIAALAARKPPNAAMPSAEWGSVWPPACGLSPARGRFFTSAAWQLPGTPSYSA